MPNATVRTLIDNISTVVLDATASDSYQDETILEIARLAVTNVIAQTNTSYVLALQGSNEYVLPTGNTPPARQLITVCFDDTQLALTGFQDAQDFDTDFRSNTRKTGRPIAYMLDLQRRTDFLVLPAPEQNGPTIGAATPFDKTLNSFLPNNFVVFYTASDLTYADTTLNDTYLALAFTVLSKEMARDSDHQDLEAAQIANTLATIFWNCSFPGIETAV